MRGICSASALPALLLVLFPDFVRSQTNQTLSAIDPRITYVGEWTGQDNGGHTFTRGAGSFSLDFQGTAVYWFSRRLHDGAIASVSLDDEDEVNIDLSEGTTGDDTFTPTVEVIFQRAGLDGGENHRLTVSWGGPGGTGLGSFLENYRIIYTTSGDATSASDSTSSPSEFSTSALSTGEASDESETSTSETISSSNPNSNSVTTSVTDASGTGTSNLGPTSTLASGPSAISSSDPKSDPNPDPDSEDNSTSDSESSNGHIGAIVGGVVGGVSGLLLASALLWLWRRRAQKSPIQKTESVTPFMPPPDDLITSPSHVKPPLTSNQSEGIRTYVPTPVAPETTLSPATTGPMTSIPPGIAVTSIRESIQDPPPVYSR